MKYYKILNESENHFGMQFHDGCCIDDSFKMDANNDNGISFYSEDVLAFLWKGPWIREVRLLVDSRVCEEFGNFRKWKTDKIILSSRERITSDVIKRLIDEGVNVTNQPTMIWVAKTGDLDLMEYLVDHGADCVTDHAILWWGVKSGNLDMVKFLVNKGADPTDYVAFVWAVDNKWFDIIKFLVVYGARIDNNVLDHAVACGDPDIIEFLSVNYKEIQNV